jgi:hypothetical protein
MSDLEKYSLIYVKEEFKAEIIAKIDEIRGVPHLPSSNKHALLSKNITW